MSELTKNYFTELYGVDVSDKIEKKNGLSYVSWPYAWAEVKKRWPGATYTVYENKDGWFYHSDGKTCWVKTGVTVNGIEHIEMLPVMDYKNRSIPADCVTSTDVNKAIQRSLTKAAARHGLGLYVYAGEDLPEEEAQKKEQVTAKPVQIKKDAPAAVEMVAKIPSLSEEMQYLNECLTAFAKTTGKPLADVKANFKRNQIKAVKDGVSPNKALAEYSKEEIKLILDMMAAEEVA